MTYPVVFLPFIVLGVGLLLGVLLYLFDEVM